MSAALGIVARMNLPGREAAATDLIQFLNASPTPYHAVREVAGRLRAAGFRELDERDEWTLSPLDRVYLTRGGGTLVALVLGAAPPSRAGFRLIGAHTDSPNLRVKPRAESVARGHRQLGVEVYGSPLLYTWLDRDLSLAGRVSLVDGSTHLVRLPGPICRVSSLAIHLSPTLATDGLRLNAQQHLAPTLSLVAGSDEAAVLPQLLLPHLPPGVTADAILAFDLSLFDVQGASLGGSAGELLCSARLDNLVSCHAATVALTDGRAALDATVGIVLHDHEEVGSQSASGASGLFVRSILERVASSLNGGGTDGGARAFARSLFVSTDMAHAAHPNHAEKHDPEHAPRLGGGPVIKVNASQSYATDAPGAALFERACRDAGFSAQRFVARGDMKCGSTIGPISAARLGIRTVDVGSPMLSMHSCREVAAVADVPRLIAALARTLESPAPPPTD